MEIKRFSDTATENRDTTDNVTSTFENFPWAVLQQNSKGINIIDSINQLLSMYHPNDGIVAYERVIKNLLILSKNLDSNLQQQIVSVVPLPKGVANDKIRNLIHKTIELIKTPNSISSDQKVTMISEEKLNTKVLNEDTEIQLNQNILIKTSPNFDLNEKFIPSVSEVFKGFPPNEISTIHTHVRNVNYMYDTLNYSIPYTKPYVNVEQNFSSNTNEQESIELRSKPKWFNTPHLLYNTNLYQSTASSYQQGFLKSVDDKYFQLSIDKRNNPCSVTNVSHALHQDTTCLKRLYKNSVISNKQNKNKMLNLEVTHGNRSSKTETNCEIFYNANTNPNSKKCTSHKNKVINVETQEYFEQELKYEQQAIQEDIYKMDVVHSEEERNDIIINIQASKEDSYVMDNFMIHKKLKISLQNFLKRAEQEILIELPILPQTKPLHMVPPISKCCKFVNEKNLENNDQLDVSNNNVNSSKDTSASKDTKQFIEKKFSTLRHIYPKPHQLQVLHNNSNTVFSKTQTVECEKKDNIGNLLYKSAVKQMKQKSLNTLQQTASITELTTFKKQYYDTLLNIQKAKMAVANSLAISSVESFTKYDPYYSNHSYQQQQLLQQHGPLTVNPQFSVHTMAQSGLSSIHNTPYSWVRYSNLRHPTMKQLRLPQQFPFQDSRNKENSVLHYVKTVDIQCFTQDKSKQMKQDVQRKKLEDIVGKLREVEKTVI